MSVDIIKSQNNELTGFQDTQNNTSENFERIYTSLHYGSDTSLAELNITPEQVMDVLKLEHSFSDSGFSEPLYIKALDFGKGQLASELLSALAAIDSVDLNSTDSVGQNLLHLVLRNNKLSNQTKSKLILQLLKHGVSPFKQDKLGTSPLLLLLNRENDALDSCRDEVLASLEHDTPETLSNFEIDGVHLLNYMAQHVQEYSPDAMSLVCKHGAASHLKNVDEIKLTQHLEAKCSPEEFVDYRIAIYHGIYEHDQIKESDQIDGVEFGVYQAVNEDGSIEALNNSKAPLDKPALVRSMSVEDYEHAILKAGKESIGHKLVRAFKAIPNKIHDKALEYRARLDHSFRPQEDTLGLLKYRATNPVDRVVEVDIDNRQHGFVPILIERQFEVGRSNSDLEVDELEQMNEECSATTSEVEARRESLDVQVERSHSRMSTQSVEDNTQASRRRQEAKDNYKLVRTQSRLSKRSSHDSDVTMPLSARRQAQRNSVSSQLSHSLPKASYTFSPESSLNSLPTASLSASFNREMCYEDDVFERQESPVKKRTRKISVQPNVAMIREREVSTGQDESYEQKLHDPLASLNDSLTLPKEKESKDETVVKSRNPSTGSLEELTISSALHAMSKSVVAPIVPQEIEAVQTRQRNPSTGAFEEKTLANGLFQIGVSAAAPAVNSKCCAVVPISMQSSDSSIEEQEESEEDAYLNQIAATRTEFDKVTAENKKDGKLKQTMDVGFHVSSIAGAIRAYPNVAEGPKEATLFLHGLSVGQQVVELVKAMKDFDDETLAKSAESFAKLGSEALDVAEAGVNALSALVGEEDMAALINTLPKGVSAAKQFKNTLVTVKDGLVHLLDIFKEMQDSKMFDDNAPAEAKRADKALDFIKHSAHYTKEIASVSRSLATASREILTLTGQGSTAAGQAVPGLGIFVAVLDIAERAVSMTNAVRAYAQMSEYKTTLKESFRDFDDLSGMVDLDTNKTNKLELKRLAFESELDNDVDTSTIDEAKRFYLVRGLKKINEKRIMREAFKMTLDVANIAAAIAELSGAGAGAGLGISVTTAGVNIGAFTVRNMKQQYHDFKSDDKSSDAKHQARLYQIETMIGLLRTIEIPAEDDEFAQKMTAAQLSEAKQLFKAAGLPLHKFLKPGLTAEKRMKLLYNALKKKE